MEYSGFTVVGMFALNAAIIDEYNKIICGVSFVVLEMLRLSLGFLILNCMEENSSFYFQGIEMFTNIAAIMMRAFVGLNKEFVCSSGASAMLAGIGFVLFFAIKNTD